MTTAESDAIALLTRIRDSAGDVASQWTQAKALMERICRRQYYGGWPSRQLKELVRKIDAADTTGNFGGVGTTGCRDITQLLVQIRNSGVVTGGGGPPAPQSLTNAQKLSLAANTAVGTQVSVTDVMLVAGGTQDGVYSVRGTSNGKEYGTLLGRGDDGGNGLYSIGWDAFGDPVGWKLRDDGANPIYYSLSDVATPDLATNWKNSSNDSPAPITVTSPVLQQLTTPSSAQGGVAVLGGTQDGVYVNLDPTGTLGGGGRGFFELLGGTGTPSGDPYQAILWNSRWEIYDAGAAFIYYSLSDVATPDLATNWKNASDDSPASITVTTFTQGQLVSGWKLGSVVYQVNGNLNGRNLYSDVLGVAPNIGWDGVKWTDGLETVSGNTAFPTIGTADAVASEANWGPVP